MSITAIMGLAGGVGGIVRTGLGALAGWLACWAVAHVAWIPAAEERGRQEIRQAVAEARAEHNREALEDAAKAARETREVGDEELRCRINPDLCD